MKGLDYLETDIPAYYRNEILKVAMAIDAKTEEQPDEERQKEAGLGQEENPEEEVAEEEEDDTGIPDEDPEDVAADYHPVYPE
jgi:hypothetical protein